MESAADIEYYGIEEHPKARHGCSRPSNVCYQAFYMMLTCGGM